MRRLLATATLLAALFAVWLPAPPAFAQPVAKRVVIVIAPYLLWDDVTATSTPTIWGLAERGAIGDINARSRTRQAAEPPTPLEGALTISAGSWAVPSSDAAAAYQVDERYEVGTAAEAFRRITGDQVGTNGIVFLGMPMTQRLNQERSFEVMLGTLGEAVEDAGGVTAAVGNSDVGYVTGEQRKVRPAALAAMNSDGLVALGEVSTRLLREDPNAPFGIETDMERFATVLSSVEEETATSKGPVLIVLDAGDAYRATKFEPQVTPGIATAQRQRALATLDEVVALAEARFSQDVIMVVSQSTGDTLAGRPEGLGPVVVSGTGWTGLVTSDSTQRSGLVTNLDVTATALNVLGLERPVQVLGNGMEPIPGPATLEERIAVLDRMNKTAVAVDGAKRAVVNTFVVLTVVSLLLGAFALVRFRHWSPNTVRWWVRGLQVALLAVLSIPVSGWLMFLWVQWPSTIAAAVTALAVTASMVFGLGIGLVLKAPMRVPVAVLSLLTATVIIVDQLLGAPGSYTNFFGYSPLLAARFYGMGNEAAAVLVGSALVGIAMLFDQWPQSTWVVPAKRFGIPVLGALVVGTAAAPFWGANVAVAVWGVAAFALAWVMMNGRHVSVRTVLWIVGVVTILVGAFAAIDLYGGGPQTHLGRAIGSAGQGGWIELWNIVARKAETNVRVLTHTNWAYILIATLAFLAFMRWRPHGDFAETLRENPHFADAITVSLIAGLVAYFTEDSGIVIPALEFFYVGVGIVWLMLARLLRAEGGSADRQVADSR